MILGPHYFLVMRRGKRRGETMFRFAVERVINRERKLEKSHKTSFLEANSLAPKFNFLLFGDIFFVVGGEGGAYR